MKLPKKKKSYNLQKKEKKHKKKDKDVKKIPKLQIMCIQFF